MLVGRKQVGFGSCSKVESVRARSSFDLSLSPIQTGVRHFLIPFVYRKSRRLFGSIAERVTVKHAQNLGSLFISDDFTFRLH